MVFAEALLTVPTLEFKKKVIHHIEEETEHYEVCCLLYGELGAGDLDEICTNRLVSERPIPRIESFLELGVAQLLYDRASAYQLQEYVKSIFIGLIDSEPDSVPDLIISRIKMPFHMGSKSHAVHSIHFPGGNF